MIYFTHSDSKMARSNDNGQRIIIAKNHHCKNLVNVFERCTCSLRYHHLPESFFSLLCILAYVLLIIIGIWRFIFDQRSLCAQIIARCLSCGVVKKQTTHVLGVYFPATTDHLSLPLPLMTISCLYAKTQTLTNNGH